MTTTHCPNIMDYVAKQPTFRRLNSSLNPAPCGVILFQSWVYFTKTRLASAIQKNMRCDLISNSYSAPLLFRRLNRHRPYPNKWRLKPPLFRRLNTILNPAPCGVQSFWAPEKFWQVSPTSRSYNKTFSTPRASSFHALRSFS